MKYTILLMLCAIMGNACSSGWYTYFCCPDVRPYEKKLQADDASAKIRNYRSDNHNDVLVTLSNPRLKYIPAYFKMQGYRGKPTCVVDGSFYEGKLSKLDPVSLDTVILLPGSDAVKIFGKSYSNGMIIIRTKTTNSNRNWPYPNLCPHRSENQ